MFRHRHDHDARGGAGRADPEAAAGREAGGAALAAIAIVDVIFAVDSVPAILAITPDAFIVFAANAFALLGLRPLFFLVAELVDRLYYLKTALAVLLIAIGAEDGGRRGVRQDRPGVLAARHRADPGHGRGRLAGARAPARARCGMMTA